MTSCEGKLDSALASFVGGCIYYAGGKSIKLHTLNIHSLF